ncbi:unnamed protein product [Caenorhabditis auriculariae]|uniref:non-specific serine/threonine protein kinase n=1 Tax=Caenorhabditis auriculariae TaxID=2777116 RepID=A0A8S1HQ34_9PELO|nr:unnamed protein product [Caenorhabditis auriculariae]
MLSNHIPGQCPQVWVVDWCLIYFQSHSSADTPFKMSSPKKDADCQRFFGYGKKIPKNVKRHCGICRQHGITVETRGHSCPMKGCNCTKCDLIRRRRSIMSTQIRLRREQDKKFQRTTDANEADVVPLLSTSSETTTVKQDDANANMCYFCQKCKNHGVLSWKKDHKKVCEYANCHCEQCDLIDSRRALDRHIKQEKAAKREKLGSTANSSEESNSNSSCSPDAPSSSKSNVPDSPFPSLTTAFSLTSLVSSTSPSATSSFQKNSIFGSNCPTLGMFTTPVGTPLLTPSPNFFQAVPSLAYGTFCTTPFPAFYPNIPAGAGMFSGLGPLDMQLLLANMKCLSELVAVTTNRVASDCGDAPPSASFEILQVLGEGAFGEVLLVADKRNPSGRRGVEKKLIRKEALLHKMLSKKGHRNVIRYIGMKNDEQTLEYYIFLEYADAGELFDQINPDAGMTVPLARHYFRQLIDGVEFIHSNGIVHRDIKPENLLLTNSGLLKISDFGMATIFRHGDKERLLEANCGTLPYAAPEIFKCNRYRAEPIDVWSCGIVLTAMLTGNLPWERADDHSESYLNWDSNVIDDEAVWKKVSVSALSLLKIILVTKVGQRATISRIRNHPFFSNASASSGGPAKRRKVGEETWDACTQIETLLKECDQENSHSRVNLSFSQPTRPEELYCSQQIVLSQGNTDPTQRFVRRMTRFCVNVDCNEALSRINSESETAGLVAKWKTENQLIVTQRDMSFVVTGYEMLYNGVKKVMLDFRRSRGDGLQFKRTFLLLRDSVQDIICTEGNDWLAEYGLTPTQQPEAALE